MTPPAKSKFLSDGPLDELIRDAVESAWGSFATFDNEAHFKFELFHRLAQRTVEGIGLAEVVPGTCTPRLHAEARPQNGKNTRERADLLICDPLQRMQFNYRPLVLLELKHSLSQRELEIEIEKARAYTPCPERMYVISALPTPRFRQQDAEATAARAPFPVTVLSPNWTTSAGSHEYARQGEEPTFEKLNAAFDAALDKALSHYGNTSQNRTHAFYWRNYQNEQATWTFPSESDFVAHLYHQLRIAVPAARLHVERPVDGTRGTTDLVLECQPEGRIAVEVKMNWNQFEKKKEDENLVSKLGLWRNGTIQTRSVVVVIQGEYAAGPRQLRDSAYARFKGAAFPLELIRYDEERCLPIRERLGRAGRS